ncbi:hypothetical protein [Mesorhizobium sp. RMAD-H1]|uniref:hypothetical protein n=1 Tax=Mesorhizobium sp. RMAD-H1 TaxID=2587065 RepID=UPI00160DBC0F|nr:hypothetical protein [Mesorhizobium sp. RMAD-H1]MBB2973943.1 hypothetical protein [Mesorhizobium sp. RMAD-H1]
MSDFIVLWPYCQLTPQQPAANLVPFTRSGGRSLGGLEPRTRTDRGYWVIDYQNIPVLISHRDQWKTWHAIRQMLGGSAGLIAVRAPTSPSAPYASGRFEPVERIPHSDGAGFSDGTKHRQRAISIKSVDVTPISATTIRLRIINAEPNLVGVKFSYKHALYETGPVIRIDGDVWTVPISPAVRAEIPDGVDLEFDQPTCLCRLADDRGMDIGHDVLKKSSYPSVSFVEAVDYWSDLAAGLI